MMVQLIHRNSHKISIYQLNYMAKLSAFDTFLHNYACTSNNLLILINIQENPSVLLRHMNEATIKATNDQKH